MYCMYVPKIFLIMICFNQSSLVVTESGFLYILQFLNTSSSVSIGT